MTPMDKLIAALRSVIENARYAADPREPARQIAAAWVEYLEATMPPAETPPADTTGGA